MWPRQCGLGLRMGMGHLVCRLQTKGRWERFPLNSWGKTTVPFPMEVAVKSWVCRLLSDECGLLRRSVR